MIALLDLLLAATFTAFGGFLPARLPYATLGTPILPDAQEFFHWKALSLGLCTSSLQVPAVWVAGTFLGARWGLASQALVLIVGLAGLPVFANGGGMRYLSLPTFGYLLGFLPAVAIIGIFSGRGVRGRKRPRRTWPKDSIRLGAGLILGQAALWTVGLIWQVIALHGATVPALWSASIRGTVQLAPTYLLVMAMLVVLEALVSYVERIGSRKPASQAPS